MGDPGIDARTLRYLKWLVTTLSVTMIAGITIIVVLMAMRFSEWRALEFPADLALPEGVTATAFTQGEGWYAVVTAENEILIFSAATGALRQRIEILSP